MSRSRYIFVGGRGKPLNRWSSKLWNKKEKQKQPNQHTRPWGSEIAWEILHHHLVHGWCTSGSLYSKLHPTWPLVPISISCGIKSWAEERHSSNAFMFPLYRALSFIFLFFFKNLLSLCLVLVLCASLSYFQEQAAHQVVFLTVPALELAVFCKAAEWYPVLCRQEWGSGKNKSSISLCSCGSHQS